MGSVAIEHGGIAVTDLTRVVEHDNLSLEVFALLGGILLGVTAHVTTADVLDGNVLDVETNVVTGDGLSESFVMHLHGLDLSGDASGGEGNNLTGLQHTSLHTTDGYRTDTTDLVDVLERETEGLVDRASGRLGLVESLEESGPLVPRHVRGLLDHVVTVPSGDRDVLDGVTRGLVTDLLQVVADLLHDLVVTGLGVLDRRAVHLVDANNDLLHTKGEGEKRVLTGLTVLRDTSLELTLTSGNDENSNIGLGSTGNHVLDEITMPGSVDDGVVAAGGLELPESDIDGDTTFTLSLQLVENPRVLEGTLAHLGSVLLELLDGTLVDTATLVDKVTSGRRLARVDMTDNDDVHVNLLLTHD
eukprot:Rmarinus@m.12839